MQRFVALIACVFVGTLCGSCENQPKDDPSIDEFASFSVGEPWGCIATDLRSAGVPLNMSQSESLATLIKTADLPGQLRACLTFDGHPRELPPYLLPFCNQAASSLSLSPKQLEILEHSLLVLVGGAPQLDPKFYLHRRI